jgi:TusA-related sulfurtransferase
MGGTINIFIHFISLTNDQTISRPCFHPIGIRLAEAIRQQRPRGSPDGQMAEMKLDLHDSLQPVALLKVNQTLRAMQTGDRLEIRGADPSTFQALMRLLPEARFTVTEARLQPAGYCMRIRCRQPRPQHLDSAGAPAPATGESR